MKRFLFLLAAAALVLPAAASAKGPSEARITGPGLDKPIKISGTETDGSPIMSLAEAAGFFPAAFGQEPNPLIARPKGDLGPKYVITYEVPGGNFSNFTIRQDLYPYAARSYALTYMKPGQPIFDMQTKGGWWTDQRLKGVLVAAGLPKTRARGEGQDVELCRVLLDREDRSLRARLVRNRSSGSAHETPPPGHRHLALTSRIRRVTGAPDPLICTTRATEHVIGVYLLETEDGLALQDCGPSTCIPEARRSGSPSARLALTDVRHLLLSHIHLDHAGAAGTLVREHPGLQVHVSEIGAPHLVDPSRLERSARRLYGDEFDTLWGELAPVPQENVHVVGASVLGLDCFPSPGHAAHHVCYVDGEGTLYTGDAAGVRILPEPPHLARRAAARDRPRGLGADDRRARARARRSGSRSSTSASSTSRATTCADCAASSGIWGQRVRQGMSEEAFVEAARGDLEEEAGDAPYYERAAPLWQSYRGLRRYWDKQLAGNAD